ncbi:ABC transporter permease subunit, partial [Pseudomonas aeruginosa]|uniref:ABC transporter permease subunit n=1 Tax=Pseudomonas aeruginosa TaxID=287 RepID=UPI0031B73E46
LCAAGFGLFGLASFFSGVLNPDFAERRHILRNASLPMITAVGMHIGELIGGTMIIENIFAWPGVGRYAVSAIFNRDYPVIQCFTLMMVVWPFFVIEKFHWSSAWI